MASEPHSPTGHEVYDDTFSGAQERPWIPPLRSDPAPNRVVPHNLLEFRELEGRERRRTHLRELWKRLPKSPLLLPDHEEHSRLDASKAKASDPLTPARAKELEKDYESELMGRCHGHMGLLRGHIGWKEFKRYAEAKEVGASSTLPVNLLPKLTFFQRAVVRFREARPRRERPSGRTRT